MMLSDGLNDMLVPPPDPERPCALDDAWDMSDDDHLLLRYIDTLPDDGPNAAQEMQLCQPAELSTRAAPAEGSHHGYGNMAHPWERPSLGAAKAGRAARLRDKNRRAQARYRSKLKVTLDTRACRVHFCRHSAFCALARDDHMRKTVEARRLTEECAWAGSRARA
jgi:hypothetical protein